MSSTPLFEKFTLPLLKLITLSIISLTLMSGCAGPKTQYYWGEYEQLIYDMYLKPGDATSGKQIELLTADIQKAQAADKQMPPGVYAHLGLMYAMQGDTDKAHQAFTTEKEMYPESKVLVNGMLKRAAGKK